MAARKKRTKKKKKEKKKLFSVSYDSYQPNLRMLEGQAGTVFNSRSLLLLPISSDTCHCEHLQCDDVLKGRWGKKKKKNNKKEHSAAIAFSSPH